MNSHSNSVFNVYNIYEFSDQIFCETISNKPGCNSVQLEFCLAGLGDVGLFFLQKLFIYVMLRLYTEFQCSIMPLTG